MSIENESIYLPDYRRLYSCFSENEKKSFDRQVELLRAKFPRSKEECLWQSVLIVRIPLKVTGGSDVMATGVPV